MTVQTSTNVASFNGDGANKVFPIGYKFNSAADLVVTLIDDEAKTTQILTLNSDFTVTGAGDEEGGVVTLVVAPTAVQRLKVTRVVDILQLTDLRNQGKFYAEIHEDVFDLLIMIDQQHESGINSSLRVAESDPEPARIPAVAQRAGKILSFDANGNPQVVAPVTDSSTELRLELAATSGSDLLGYKARTVAGRLNDMASVRDYGGAIDALGRNPTIDAQIIAEADEETDTLKAGHLAVAKQLFGVRRHGSVASFRGNVGNEGFSTEVTGLSGGKHLANYGSIDYVTLFMDIADQPYNSWEIIDAPTYNAAGFVVDATVGANLKTGMVVRTNHATPYWGFINSYDAGTGQVTLLDGWWIKDATEAATPPSGSGLRINPNSKVWTYNANAILREDGRADTAVIAELGMANFKATARPNGMDLVMLGQSSAEGGAAFLARKGGAIGWQYGFAAKSGSIAGMHSGGVPRGYVAENCTEGVVVGTPDGSGLAMAVRVGGITASASTTMSLNGKGQIRRLGHNTVITNGQDAGGTLLSLNAGVSLYTTTLDGTLLLPNTGLTDGDTVRIIKPQSTGTMTVSGNGSNIVVASGSVASFGFTGVANLTCVYYQGAWYIGQ